MRFKIKSILLLFWALFIAVTGVFSGTNDIQKRRKKSPQKTETKKDSTKRSGSFLDSLKNDSLFATLKGRFTINVKKKVIPKVKDPFDPFAHQAFYRVGQGKTWFFIISLLLLGLFIYYRAAFPKQFYQRYRGVFNSYYFNELITDRSLSFTSGSLVCLLISTFVMAQVGLLVAIYSKYLQLNSVPFFIVMLVGVSAWKMLLYFFQRMQAFVFFSGEVSRSLPQKQITIDFWVSVILFPIINSAYYNPYRLKSYPVAQYLLILILIWFILRMLVQLIFLFREKKYSFTNILYFGALEVLPHAILTKALFSISQNT